MNYKLNNKLQAAAYKVKLVCYLMSVFVILSCKNQDTKSLVDAKPPVGKWKAISMQNKDQTLLYDTNGNYFMELNLENRMTVTAEDNTLSGYLIDQPSDSLKMKNIEITDVCCNSDTADVLFRFFYVPVKYVKHENKLTLSSEKGVLELRK